MNLKEYFNYLLTEPYSDPCAVDFNHAMLLFGTILSAKPATICEIGLGSGFITKTILAAIEYNQVGNLICVDSMHDRFGNLKESLLDYLKSHKKVSLKECTEKDFVFNCKENVFDLLISDADHHHSHEWIYETFRIVRPNGYIFAHDVTNKEFPGLREYIHYCKRYNFPFELFNTSSRGGERCDSNGWIKIKNTPYS
jgi:predicted O-methyltransferase YrrM